MHIVITIYSIYGQKCDDEMMARLNADSSIIRDYSREISLPVTRTKPAPLSVKDLFSVFTIGALTKPNR